jgi:hypothetical protein
MPEGMRRNNRNFARMGGLNRSAVYIVEKGNLAPAEARREIPLYKEDRYEKDNRMFLIFMLLTSVVFARNSPEYSLNTGIESNLRYLIPVFLTSVRGKTR